jgi:O-6-methylguanine DNA methyltransferase
MTIERQLAGLTGDLPHGVTEGVALGTGLADGYDLYDSPLGEVAVTFNPVGVSSVDLADDDFASRFAERHGRAVIRAEAPSSWARRIAPALEAGRPGDLPLDLRLVTPFRATVLRAAGTIPRGQVRSYSWLAAQSSRPGAARAVGSTMASNPVPLIIPCHRVVRSDGHIGAYSLGGPDNKWRLLQSEGADPAHLEELARGGVRVQGNKSTGIYCYPTCSAIRRSKSSNVVDFHSSEKAGTAGFRPCQLCRPV